MPLCIQLHLGAGAPVWTPNDAAIEWTCAKILHQAGPVTSSNAV